MKISIAQLNYHIGDFEKNRELICSAIRTSKAEGSELVIFSELSVPGYPPLDLLDHADFINRCSETVESIAKECKDITAIVGSPTINKNPEGKKLYNSALVLSEGKPGPAGGTTKISVFDNGYLGGIRPKCRVGSESCLAQRPGFWAR